MEFLMKILCRIFRRRPYSLNRNLTFAFCALVCASLVIFLAVSHAQDRAGSNDENCQILIVKKPSRWEWTPKEQDTRAFLQGDMLLMNLSPQAQESLPEAPPPPGTQNGPGTKDENNKKVDEKEEKVKVCANWQDDRESITRTNKTGSLRLDVMEDNQGTQLQVHLNGSFPWGIRNPVEISITSSNAALLKEDSQSILISSKWLTTLLSSLFVALIYLCLAASVQNFYRPSHQRTNRGWKIFDPAVISASDYGSASLANLQILWFSLIVAWILAFGWLVMGRLLNPSSELLSLLGISGASNVLAKSLTANKQRLSLDSWNWLVERNYLKKESAIDPIDVAKWGDFVIDGGVLDPSRYQLMIFGFLVGINLLFGNALNLETFKIPGFFLSLQAISSGLYLFGKSVNPNTKDELEVKIVDLSKNYPDANIPIQDSEKRFLARVIESLYGYNAIGKGLGIPPTP